MHLQSHLVSFCSATRVGNAGLPDALPNVFWDFARPIVGQGALVIPTYSNPPNKKNCEREMRRRVQSNVAIQAIHYKV